jgi:hypothetical protein
MNEKVPQGWLSGRSKRNRIYTMTKVVCGLVVTGAVLFGQSVPDNAAGDAIERRVESLNLLHPKSLRANLQPDRRDNRIKFAGSATPKVCAIPLLRANPAPTNDQMRVVRPPVRAGESSRGEQAQVPAPACDSRTASLFAGPGRP